MQLHKRLLFSLPLYWWENGDVAKPGWGLLGLRAPREGLADGRAAGSPSCQHEMPG